MESCRKSIFYSCALLVYTVSFSRGQRFLSEFSSASPALCGKTKIVNGDNAFFFNEVLSSEARSQASYHERSKGMKYFNNPPGNPPGSTFPSRDTSLGIPNPLNSNVPNFSGSSYKNKQYKKKLKKMTNMLPRYKSKFSYPTREPTAKPLDFSNFMLKQFTHPFKNEKRRFAEQPERIVTTKKPKIKPDMLSGLSGKVKVEGKKKRNSSHSNHRDKPSKLPPMIQHIIEKKKQKKIAAVELTSLVSPDGNVNPYQPPGPNAGGSVVGPGGQSRPMPMGPMGNGAQSPQMGPSGGGGGGWMDVLGSLGPDKIQKLKQLLGRMGNEPEETKTGLKIPVRRVPYETENRRMEAPRGDVYELYPDRPRGERRRRPQAYKLNRYGENQDGGADLPSRNRYGNAAGPGDMGRKDPDLYPEADYPVVPNADAGEMDEGSLNRRVKRAAPPEDRAPSDSTDAKSCTWVFRKGNNCKRMVIKMQYWVDGVRDCGKEYLQIRGSRNINSPSDKLCGGQESLTPYIVDGDEVSIKHFRDIVNTPGLTKFKGMIQCEQ